MTDIREVASTELEVAVRLDQRSANPAITPECCGRPLNWIESGRK